MVRQVFGMTECCLFNNEDFCNFHLNSFYPTPDLFMCWVFARRPATTEEMGVRIQDEISVKYGIPLSQFSIQN